MQPPMTLEKRSTAARSNAHIAVLYRRICKPFCATKKLSVLYPKVGVPLWRVALGLSAYRGLYPVGGACAIHPEAKRPRGELVLVPRPRTRQLVRDTKTSPYGFAVPSGA